METIKPCILVTDDSRVVRKAANAILSENHQVIEAVSGKDALSVLNTEQQIDAVLLDLWMPDMDGFEVLRQIAQSTDARLHEIPVIVITGDGEDEKIRDTALSLGAADFIGKPFSSSRLLSSLNGVLSDKSANEALSQTTEIKASVKEQKKLSRREQLVREGAGLLQRCVDERQPFSLMKLRIEHAGALYHKTGEDIARDVLRQIGLKITHETRRKDFLVRLSVTDFAIVMPRTTLLEANEVANRLLRAVRHHIIEFDGSRFHLSMSGGVVTPRLAHSPEFAALLSLADVRLEMALNAGGSQSVSCDRVGVPGYGEPAVSLDTATEQLKRGDIAPVQNKVPNLLRKVFPLLVFVNARFKLGIDDALRKIHEVTKQ